MTVTTPLLCPALSRRSLRHRLGRPRLRPESGAARASPGLGCRHHARARHRHAIVSGPSIALRPAGPPRCKPNQISGRPTARATTTAANRRDRLNGDGHVTPAFDRPIRPRRQLAAATSRRGTRSYPCGHQTRPAPPPTYRHRGAGAQGPPAARRPGATAPLQSVLRPSPSQSLSGAHRERCTPLPPPPAPPSPKPLYLRNSDRSPAHTFLPARMRVSDEPRGCRSMPGPSSRPQRTAL